MSEKARHLARDELVGARKIESESVGIVASASSGSGSRCMRLSIGGFDHAPEIQHGHAGTHRFEPRALLPRLAFCQVGVRLEDQYGSVAIVDEVAPE